MSIEVQKKFFSLKTKNSEYQMEADPYGILTHIWYGAKTGEPMNYLLDYPDVGFSGQISEVEDDRTYSLDTKLLEYPTYGMGDYRLPAIQLQEPNGANILDLRYDSYDIQKGVPELEGLPHLRNAQDAETLIIHMKDKNGKTAVDLYYTVLEEEDLIARHAVIYNISDEPVILEQAASLNLDLPDQEMDLIHFHGRHVKERTFERIPVAHGIFKVASNRGSSSHQHNPTVIFAEKHTGEDNGEAYGIALMYSGSFEIASEKDQMNQIRVTAGLNPSMFSWTLEPGSHFTTPQALMSYSNQGLAKLSSNFHHTINDHVVNPRFQKVPRPILINNWEATYFDFNGDKIVDIAKKASKLGIDMMVLDDGWFGKRDLDNEGLGDWFVNEEKLGGTLESLINRIKDLGMSFGIWVEPEMISENSQLYRQHPEWALQIPGHAPARSRCQLVLDYSNPEVVDYMYTQLKHLLEQHDISYVKWDMNRSINDWYSQALPASRQKEISHRYVLGLYSLLDRLTKEFPNVLFEGCAGGGGRFDAGMLYYTPQIWTSDDTDAHERCHIQYGTSFFYPVSTMGAHVSAVPNHQTGRKTSLEARGTSAMHGTFGYELDLNTMTEEEQEIVKEQTEWYHKLQPLIYQGEYYRLASPEEENRSLWMFVAPDQSSALLQGILFETRPNALRQRVRLKGLNPDIDYVLTATNFNRHEELKPISGKALMEGGILLPVTWGTDSPVSMMFRRAEDVLPAKSAE